MIKKSSEHFEVEGCEFLLSLYRNHDPKNDSDTRSMDVGPLDPGPTLIGIVVLSCWKDRAKDVLASFKTRVGVAVEDASYGFQEEDPALLPPGVTITLLDKEETVTEAFFTRFVAEFGLAYMKAAAEVGLPAHEELRPQLLALRRAAP